MTALTVEEARAAAAQARDAARAAERALKEALDAKHDAEKAAKASAEAAKKARLAGAGVATVAAGELLRALQTCQRAIPKKVTVPALGLVRIEAADGKLQLRGGALDIQVESEIPAKAVKPFAGLVNGRLWVALLANVPKAAQVEVRRLDGAVHLKVAGGLEASTKWEDPGDYLVKVQFQPGTRAEFCGSEFRKALPRLFMAAAPDDARPVLTGVHYRPDSNEWAAADGFRLTVLKMAPLEGSLGEGELIFPPAFLSAAGLVQNDDAVAIEINAGRTHFRVFVDGATYTGTLIHGTYPNYVQLIPSEWTTRVTFGRDAFREALRPAAVIAADGGGIIRVEAAPETGVSLAGRADEIGEVRSPLAALIEGEPNKIAFNAHYLKQLALQFDGDFTLAWSSPSAQAVAHPMGSTALTHVLMPMFVQW